MSSNPLLEKFKVPNQAPPFTDIEEEHYLPAVKAAIEDAKANIASIKAIQDEPSFDNTIVALESASELLGIVAGIFYNQLHAAGTDKLQALAEDIGPLSANFSSDVTLDPDLFARVRAVYDQKESLSLSEEENTLLDDTYKSFVRGGALLEGENKDRFREISEKLSVAGPTFANNVKKSAEDFEMFIADEADLSGLPDTAIAAAKLAAEEREVHNKWLFTLDYPSYVPFITYADNRALREQIWRAFSSKAYKDQYDNCEIVLKIVKLRNERAKLLGYDSHAEYVLERRMAETPKTVYAFLDKLKAAYKPAALQELETLKDFARDNGGPEDLKPWDVAYYSEKLKQTLFNFSSEDLRPYFQLDHVIQGVFDHYAKLFGLRFEPNNAYPVWHKDVTAYDVFSQDGDKFMGTLYADFYPRKGKKEGAWKTSYRDQGLFGGKKERPVIAIVCNFTKPTKDTPSLLTFGEVETFFHEMGHATHGLLSDVTYASNAGTNVLWDFVELPSQVQENWCSSKETLDLFARHYQTGESIPEDLIDKMNKAKNFMVGWGGLRQVNFALLDMAWHTGEPDDIEDVTEFEDEVTKDTMLFARLSGPASTAFSHIFAGGYAAGYYSYKWAEVLDADTFELFKEKGLYDQPTAQSYITEVLSKGGSEHPKILYKRFRGRDADPDALLRREGLQKSPGQTASQKTRKTA